MICDLSAQKCPVIVSVMCQDRTTNVSVSVVHLTRKMYFSDTGVRDGGVVTLRYTLQLFTLLRKKQNKNAEPWKKMNAKTTLKEN